jgi:dUTPase
MKIFVKDIPGLKLPVQANEGEDAAYDIVATTPPQIVGEFIERPLDKLKLYRRVAFIEYGTNLFIAPDEYDEVVWGRILNSAGAIDWTDVPVKHHTQLWPRSSISKQNLVLANSIGLVDSGYRNQILCRFKYIFQPEDMVVVQEDMLRVYGIVRNEYVYQQGDKIIQIKACPNVPITFEKVKELPESKRGLGGFGASGR